MKWDEELLSLTLQLESGKHSQAMADSHNFHQNFMSDFFF